MKILGDDVYIQRGENWSLDFEIVNSKGEPYTILKTWTHPYLAITITAARYSQEGDYRHTWWLDLDRRYVEGSDGTLTLVPLKRFISTEALYLDGEDFSAQEAINTYGTRAGGRIVLDEDSDFDITNYLFYIDPNNDNNRTYKYLKSYTISGGSITNEVWEEYDLRIIKGFDTKEWVEQRYLYDIKVLTGETIDENIYAYMTQEGYKNIPALPWYEDDTMQQIERIDDVEKRIEYTELVESNMPIMPDYETKLLVLQPTNIYVSANIQKGV